MTKSLKDKIVKVIDLYCDNPLVWIELHAARIRELCRQDGQAAFLETLQICCDAGAINQFFEKYNVFKAYQAGYEIYEESRAF